MANQDLAYSIDGKTFTGYLADGARGRPAPGVLVCHQGIGLTDHTRERARMLAELGYVAFAPDLFGEVAIDLEHAKVLQQAAHDAPAVLRQRVRAGLDALIAQPSTDRTRLAAIGFCFGGGVVLDIARSQPDVACVVAFHPGLILLPEQDDREVTAKVMVCVGAQDPVSPASTRERFVELMTKAVADWQLLIYGQAGHSFTDRDVAAFNLPGFFHHHVTDLRAWAAMRQLFDETFGPL